MSSIIKDQKNNSCEIHGGFCTNVGAVNKPVLTDEKSMTEDFIDFPIKLIAGKFLEKMSMKLSQAI